MIGITAGIGAGTAFGMSCRDRNKGAGRLGRGSDGTGDGVGAAAVAASAGAASAPIPAVIPIIRPPDDPGIDDEGPSDEFTEQIGTPRDHAKAQAGGWRGFWSRWGG